MVRYDVMGCDELTLISSQSLRREFPEGGGSPSGSKVLIRVRITGRVRVRVRVRVRIRVRVKG